MAVHRVESSLPGKSSVHSVHRGKFSLPKGQYGELFPKAIVGSSLRALVENGSLVNTDVRPDFPHRHISGPTTLAGEIRSDRSPGLGLRGVRSTLSSPALE